MQVFGRGNVVNQGYFVFHNSCTSCPPTGLRRVGSEAAASSQSKRGRSFLFLCAAFALATPALASAASQPSALTIAPDAQAKRVAMVLDFVGKFGADHDDTVTNRLVLDMRAKNKVVVLYGKTMQRQIDALRSGDGMLHVPATAIPYDTLEDYNSIVAAARALSSTAVGTTANASVRVKISPEAWDDVPVTVRVVENDGTHVALEASGAKHGTLKYGNFKTPIDVSAKLTAQFGPDGRFRTADFSAAETVHLASDLEMSYRWRLSFDPAAPPS